MKTSPRSDSRARSSTAPLGLGTAAAGGARWSDVKRLLQAEEGRPISDSEVTKLLRNLVDYGFLEKRGELYAVPDPVLRRSLRDIQCLI